MLWIVDSRIDISLHRLSIFKTIREVKTNYSYDNFRHPKLSNEELRLGCKLGLDSRADTGCSGRYAYVEEFVIGKTVTATGFSSALGKLDNLPYAHVHRLGHTQNNTVHY